VREVLEGNVVLDIEGIDRLYLNLYQPMLQTGGGVATFFKRHHGAKVASTTLMAPMTHTFVKAIHDFAQHEGWRSSPLTRDSARTRSPASASRPSVPPRGPKSGPDHEIARAVASSPSQSPERPLYLVSQPLLPDIWAAALGRLRTLSGRTPPESTDRHRLATTCRWSASRPSARRCSTSPTWRIWRPGCASTDRRGILPRVPRTPPYLLDRHMIAAPERHAVQFHLEAGRGETRQVKLIGAQLLAARTASASPALRPFLMSEPSPKRVIPSDLYLK
jgi:hypothetical protein